jgi:hypothetical protein
MNSLAFIAMRNLFGRWTVTCAEDPDLGWSGRRWVPFDGYVQISNFPTREDAIAYGKKAGLVLCEEVETGQAPSLQGEPV